MIVLDTSVFVDAIIPFDVKRHDLALNLIDLISRRGLEVYEPQLLEVELSAVLVRYKPRRIVENHVNRVLAHVAVIAYDELHKTALQVALATGCRAVDAFFIACATETGSILVSNDRAQVQSARRAGVRAFYLLEEHQKLRAELQKL